jgi:WhiB family transcriptional regulator, redox-sensing transcriptional regulator
MEWVHRAKCKDEDPELFFPIGTTGPAAVQIDAAKSICMRCEVRVQCLEWALATAQDAGVWGGMSEEERRAFRRARRREAVGLRPLVVG